MDRAKLKLVVVLLASTVIVHPANAYLTFGRGYASKWGDEPTFGTGAVITWGYMADGTDVDPDFRIDPFEHPDISGVVGTSNISQLRSTVDADYGTGAFDAAIQRAFDTWSAVANITFLGPMPDSGLPVDSIGATDPMIRIGAFLPDSEHWFVGASAVGFGPPGPAGPEQFPLSGDILFNLAGLGSMTPYQIAPGVEDEDSVDVFHFGDDVEGLFLHELGHAIGLGHTPWGGEDPDQRVMYVGDDAPAPWCCQSINRELHLDDIAGAQAIYGIRGDYNRDGRVDAADYTVWRNEFDETAIPGTGADGNIDGMVTSADYLLWKANYGSVASIGFGEQQWPEESLLNSVVPEPSMLMSLIAAATYGLAVGNYRNRRVT